MSQWEIQWRKNEGFSICVTSITGWLYIVRLQTHGQPLQSCNWDTTIDQSKFCYCGIFALWQQQQEQQQHGHGDLHTAATLHWILPQMMVGGGSITCLLQWTPSSSSLLSLSLLAFLLPSSVQQKKKARLWFWKMIFLWAVEYCANASKKILISVKNND